MFRTIQFSRTITHKINLVFLASALFLWASLPLFAQDLVTGVVRSYDASAGVGFISTTAHSDDIVVQVSALDASNIDTLVAGNTVLFAIVEGSDGRKIATDLVLLK